MFVTTPLSLILTACAATESIPNFTIHARSLDKTAQGLPFANSLVVNPTTA
jgi:hypothetical protein